MWEQPFEGHNPLQLPVPGPIDDAVRALADAVSPFIPLLHGGARADAERRLGAGAGHLCCAAAACVRLLCCDGVLACALCCAAAACRAFASCQMQVIVLRKVRAAVVQVFLRVPLVWVQGDVFRRSAVSIRSSWPLKIKRA